MFDYSQVVDGHAAHDGRGHDVDTLVHPVVADGLGAQDATVLRRENQFQAHLHGTGIVAGRVVGMNDQRMAGNVFGFAEFLGGTGHAYAEIENLGNGGAHGAVVAAELPAKHVAGHDPPLLVGRTRQRDGGLLAGQGMQHLDGIAGGKDVRIAGPQLRIGQDMTPGSRNPR